MINTDQTETKTVSCFLSISKMFYKFPKMFTNISHQEWNGSLYSMDKRLAPVHSSIKELKIETKFTGLFFKTRIDYFS